MTGTIKCNICVSAPPLDQAAEMRSVRSNVRKFQHEHFTMWRCPNCRSLHALDEVDLDYYYRHYPLWRHELDDLTRHFYRNRLRLLRKHGFSAEHTLLDVGCGQGCFVQFLQEEGYQAIGYDAYIDAYADREVLARQYDVVTSYDVIEHVDDPQAFLRQLVESLKPGGLLILGTPDADEIDLNDPEMYINQLHTPYHRHILTEEILLKLGQAFGLKAIQVSHRFYTDTLYPFLNSRFGEAYQRRCGGVIDILFEEPQLNLVYRSPQLLFYALAGYFLPPRSNMTACFRLALAGQA